MEWMVVNSGINLLLELDQDIDSVFFLQNTLLEL